MALGWPGATRSKVCHSVSNGKAYYEYEIGHAPAPEAMVPPNILHLYHYTNACGSKKVRNKQATVRL